MVASPSNPFNRQAQTDDYEGGCFCGHIRYSIQGQPLEVTHCHCSICRRVSGAPFVTWITVATANFSFTAAKPSSFQSSSQAERTFCNQCGTALTFSEIGRPHQIDVTVGSLDRPNDISPDEHIWVSSRLQWLHLQDGLPEYPQENW
jgi:hypothetical protein